MYTVDAYSEAQEGIAALPTSALSDYAEVLDRLRDDPWSGRPYVDAEPVGNVRVLTFGPDSRGLITYLILEDQQRVVVLRVQWAG